MPADARQLTIGALAKATDRIVARSPAIYSEDFRTWYAAYPRKRSPGDAWKAWQAIAERPALSVMLRALDWQRGSATWIRDAGRWIPYPASYLRGRAWEDEPESATAARAGYCPFHATRRNDGYRAPRPLATCPACKHEEARRGTRAGEPKTIREIADESIGTPAGAWPIAADLRDSPELRADFARLFPGQAWPGFAAAWRAVAGRGR